MRPLMNFVHIFDGLVVFGFFELFLPYYCASFAISVVGEIATRPSQLNAAVHSRRPNPSMFS